jgi:hypothetical protein
MAKFRTLRHPPLGPPPEPLAEASRQELLVRLEKRLGLVWTQPVQMLVDVRGFNPIAVSVSAAKGGSAACTWFRNVKLEGGKVVAGDLDAVSLVLCGNDAIADQQTVAATEAFRDEAGRPLPLPPDWLDRVREQEKPLLAHWCRTTEAAGDTLLWAAAQTIAELFFEPEVAA